MAVDRRILGIELDRTLQRPHRIRDLALAQHHPAQAVDDRAVVRAVLHRLVDHRARLRQVLAHVGPGVAEIVQHERLIRGERQRVLEVGLGLVPLVRALVADAAIVEHQPVARPGRLDPADGAIVGGDRFGEALLAAQHVALAHRRERAVGIVVRDPLQLVHRVVGMAQLLGQVDALQPDHADQRVVVRHRGEHLQRVLEVVLAFQHVGRQQPRGGEIGPQVEREAQQQHGEVAGVLRAQRRRQRQIGLGDPVRRTRHRRSHAGGGQRRQGDRHLGRIGRQLAQDALRLAGMAVPRLRARQDLRQAQVHAAELGLRLVIELRGVRRAAGLIGDQRGVQRIDASGTAGRPTNGRSVASAASVRPSPCCDQATSSGCSSCVRPWRGSIAKRCSAACQWPARTST